MGLGRLTIKLFYFFDIFPHKQKTMVNDIRFMERITHPEVATGVKMEVDLNDLRSTYGDNFNTLIVTNTDTGDDIEIYLDGVKVAYVTANNGVYAFDWETGINYNFLSIENAGAGTISANAVKISVGKTGGV